MRKEDMSEMMASGYERLGPEAVAFAVDLGICMGAACPMSKGGCDPRCPALAAWIEAVSDG